MTAAGPAPGLPSYGRFLSVFFLRPTQLHRHLRASGIYARASMIRLWRLKGTQGDVARAYLARVGVLVLVAMSLDIPLFAGMCAGLALPTRWDYFTAGTVGGLAVGASVALVVDTALGVAACVACGASYAVLGVLFGLMETMNGDAGNVALGDGLAVAFGVTAGAAIGVAIAFCELVSRMTQGEPTADSSSLAVGLAGVVGLSLFGYFPPIVAVAFTGASLLGMFWLWLWPFEACASMLVYAIERLTGKPTLHLTPVLCRELIYGPLPFLGQHLLANSEQRPGLVRQVLAACETTPAQRRVRRRLLPELQGREITRRGIERRFEQVLETGLGDRRASTWLPPSRGADSLVLSFRDVARYLAAARDAANPHHASIHMDSADRLLAGLRTQCTTSRRPLMARALAPALDAWTNVAAEMRREVQAAATGVLANPFRPGDALGPERGREVFRGREREAREVELLLADAHRSASVALLGPRRSGKSSLLKMLPVKLPDTVCVFFDLQDHPVDSPAGFFRALARTAAEQALGGRRLPLPQLPDGPPFEAGSAWLRAIENAPGDWRLLICIDEFERLEGLFSGQADALHRLMGLFRATIQNRRRVRLLVSGAAPFEELGALWNDYFINVQELALDLLDHDTAVDLVRRPIPGFPPDAVPSDVAELTVARTGGHPFLLQAYGALLVERLNGLGQPGAQRRWRAAVREDVGAVEERVLERWRAYFADTYNGAPPAAQAALRALARGQYPRSDEATRRWLRRRCLLTDDDTLRIPAIGAWLRHEGLA